MKRCNFFVKYHVNGDHSVKISNGERTGKADVTSNNFCSQYNRMHAETKDFYSTETNSGWEYQCEIGPNTTEVIWSIGNQSKILSRCSIGSQSCDQRFDCVIATINGTSSLLYINDSFVKENAGIVGYAELINNVKGDIRLDAKNRSVNWACEHITTAVSETSMLITDTPATTSKASITSTELTTTTWKTSITISETYTSSGKVSRATSKASAINNKLSTATTKSITTTSDTPTNITETSTTTSEASTTSTELTPTTWETSITISETNTSSGEVSTTTSKASAISNELSTATSTSITTTRETSTNITETSTTTSKESTATSEGTTTASDTFNATKVSTTEKYTVSNESSHTSSSNKPSEAVSFVNITTEPSTRKVSTISNKPVTTSDHSTQSIHSQDSSGGDLAGIIAGSVVGIIALCFIVAVLFVVYKRRQKKETSFPPVDRNSPDVAVVVDCVNPVYQTSEKSPDTSLPPAVDTQKSNCDVSQPEVEKTDISDEIDPYAATSTTPSTTTPSSEKEPDKPAMVSTSAYMHASATTEPAVDVYAVVDKPKKNNNFTDHAQPLFGKNVDVVAKVSDELYAVADKCGKPLDNRSRDQRSNDGDSKDKGPLGTLNTSLSSDDHNDKTTDDRVKEMLSGDVYSQVNKQKQIPESSSSPTQSKF